MSVRPVSARPVPPGTLYAIAAGWLTGCALQLQQSALWLPAWYALLCATAVLLLSVRTVRQWKNPAADSDDSPNAQSTARTLLLPALLTAALGFSSTGWRAALYDSQRLHPSLEGVDITMQVRIADLPRWSAPPHSSSRDVRLTVVTEAATLDGKSITLPHTLRLSWYGKYARSAAHKPPPELRIGQRWELTARLKAPHGNLNPHGFDYELWLWQQRIGATGYVRNGSKSPPPQLLSQPSWWQQPIAQWRQQQRDAIRRHLHHSAASGVTAALLTGDQAAIDTPQWQLYRDTGVAHLMSISGLHITMFAWLAIALLGRLWRQSYYLCTRVPAQHAALVGGLLCATLYAWFSGMGIPAQRTICMLATVVLLRLLGRQWHWHLTWLLVAMVVVAFDPWALLQPGFWLSFVAVGVLIAHGRLLSPVTQTQHTDNPMPPQSQHHNTSDIASRDIADLPLTDRHEYSDSNRQSAIISGTTRLLRSAWLYLRSIVREQAVITLTLAPLTLLLFKQASLVGLAANLIAVPLVTLLITPLSMLGMLWAECWTLATWLVVQMNTVLSILAEWPHAVLYMAVRPFTLYLVTIAGCLLLVLQKRLWLRLFGLPLAAALWLWQPPQVPHGDMQVVFLDTGQGSAIHVQTRSHHLLYDTGARWSSTSNAGSRTVLPYLRAVGAQPDTIAVSHSDNDHSGGLEPLLTAFPDAALIASYDADTTTSNNASNNNATNNANATDAADHRHRRSSYCDAGSGWEWDGIAFQWLHPTQAQRESGSLSSNDRSCVLHIRQSRPPHRSVLLTGDITRRIEKQLVEQALEQDDAAGTLRANVLLLPHHGSNSSSSRDMLWAVSPDLAVSQSGYRNSFGHPAEKTQSRLQRMHIPHLNTAQCGAVRWRSWQPDNPHCYRRRHPRYWRHHLPVTPEQIPHHGR